MISFTAVPLVNNLTLCVSAQARPPTRALEPIALQIFCIMMILVTVLNHKSFAHDSMTEMYVQTRNYLLAPSAYFRKLRFDLLKERDISQL